MASQIQRERIKQCFIDTAKKIIQQEGVASITVRKVAEKAGFSYATIYNYFENQEHLLWYVTMSFMDELIQAFSPLLKPGAYTVADLKNLFLAYTQYFLKNPAVFELFFFIQTGNPPEEFQDQLSGSKLGMLLAGILKDFESQGIIDKNNTDALGDLISTSVHGLLLMYFSKKNLLTEDMVSERLSAMLDYLFQKGGK